MHENLFEPIQLASVSIPNRIVRTAHSTAMPWVDADNSLIEYHRARARGGVGLSFIEIGGVHLSSPSPIPVYDDGVIAGFQKIKEAIEPYGMRIFQQLWHAGNASPINLLGGPLWSASDLPNPSVGQVPVPMTKAMIDDLVDAFVQGARRVKAGGLDGIELHGAHGYLIGQFLSPVTNRRDDDYGGPLENRMRLLRELLMAVRAEVGADFPVGVRLSASEEVDGGLEPEESAEIARAIEPLVDFVNVSLASYYRFYRMLAPMDEPLGYELPTSTVVTRAVGVPTIVSGRIMTLDHASEIVASGVADMVSMVRALIADPALVNKTKDGRAAEVRPCIGSSQGCLGGVWDPKPGFPPRLGCVVNPTAGVEEYYPSDIPDPAGERKKVLVVGGGPAGLEAARAAALRGHEVVLHEMTRQLGGQVAMASTAPHRGDYGAITRWLSEEVERLKVTVRLRSAVDPDVIAAEQPDATVIAAGSTPRRDGFQAAQPGRRVGGADLPHVYTSWDLFGFGGRARIGARAVLFDDTGGYEAVSAAEALVAAGASVLFVTRHNRLGASVPAPEGTLQPAKERLLSAPFELITNCYLTDITASDVGIGVIGGPGRLRRAADTVVYVGYNTPNRELVDAVDASAIAVHVVGDAAGGSTLQKAIKEGHLAGRGI